MNRLQTILSVIRKGYAIICTLYLLLMICSWDQVPHNKKELILAYGKTVVQHPTIFHVGIVFDRLLLQAIVDVDKMLQEKENILYPYAADHVMEPYSIIRRSYDNPIFHPYFINYGFNKQELMNRMTFLRIKYFLFITQIFIIMSLHLSSASRFLIIAVQFRKNICQQSLLWMRQTR